MNRIIPFKSFSQNLQDRVKVMVLKVLMETANRFTLRRDSNKCAYVACAITGKAAVNIDRNTVHTSFHISINTKKRMPLGCDGLQTVCCNFDGVCTIFVDEGSMMSADVLNQVGDRLRFFTNEQLEDTQIDDAIRLFYRNVDAD